MANKCWWVRYGMTELVQNIIKTILVIIIFAVLPCLFFGFIFGAFTGGN